MNMVLPKSVTPYFYYSIFFLGILWDTTIISWWHTWLFKLRKHKRVDGFVILSSIGHNRFNDFDILNIVLTQCLTTW